MICISKISILLIFLLKYEITYIMQEYHASIHNIQAIRAKVPNRERWSEIPYKAQVAAKFVVLSVTTIKLI